MKDEMTVAEALKHARHDFLNELQLIRLNADLGKWDRIGSLIDEVTEKARQFSFLSRLELPKTEEWLLTAAWRYPEIGFRLVCEAQSAPACADGQLTAYLEAVFRTLHQQLDPERETGCRIFIQNERGTFTVRLEFTEQWTELALPAAPERLSVRKECGEEHTDIIVTAQMEG